MDVGNKNKNLDMVLDIRTNVIRLVIDMGAGTVRLESPENAWGPPSAACRFCGGWCG